MKYRVGDKVLFVRCRQTNDPVIYFPTEKLNRELKYIIEDKIPLTIEKVDEETKTYDCLSDNGLDLVDFYDDELEPFKRVSWRDSICSPQSR